MKDSAIRQQVSLLDARFFAYHGYYPEEQVLGNEFFVDIDVTFIHPTAMEDRLGQTVNYEVLYQIARSAMQHPRKLLETVAADILNETLARFPFATSVRVAIRKSHPPFGGDRASAKVSLYRERDN